METPGGGGQETSLDGGGSGSFLTEKTVVLGLKVYSLITVAVGILVCTIAAAVVVYIRRYYCRRRRTARLIPVSSSSAAKSDVAGDGKRKEKATVIDVSYSCSVCSLESSPLTAAGSNPARSPKSEPPVAVPWAGRNREVMGEIGWGRTYSLSELEAATEGFKRENVIGEGGYGIVYRGVFPDRTVVAVKCLLDKKGQAEEEFMVEAEAIGKVRHKNLVGLIGYCAEGSRRMLVFEYIDNGNLEQWLHGHVGRASPLTWDIRMKVAIGIAKGVTYLHEGLEPRVVHRDIKSSNILLDKQWNPKVSDFGLAKLLVSDLSYITTRVMGTFGYVAPEYASTGMLNEASDIYSFGVLLMEIISGRSPVDYRRPTGEISLVDWFKSLVGSRQIEEVVDPLIGVPPSPRVLNRVVLVCLRCIDSDAQKRPKMGQIVHMLEGDDFPFRMEHRCLRASRVGRSSSKVARIPQMASIGESESGTVLDEEMQR